MTKDIKEIVFESLGYVSMCWEPKPTGVFDSVLATDKGNELMEQVKNHAKQQSIAFIPYRDRYYREDSAKFRRACDKAGGMLTWASLPDDKIYDLFIDKTPIESVSMPGVIYKYDEGKEVAWHGDKKLS